MGPKLELEIRIDRGGGEGVNRVRLHEIPSNLLSIHVADEREKKKKYETNYPKHFSLQLSVLNPSTGDRRNSPLMLIDTLLPLLLPRRTKETIEQRVLSLSLRFSQTI